jgi:hypothetical protein
MALLYLRVGAMFGFILSRSGAADYNYIQSMFLFTSFQLYGIIGTAIAITAPGIWLIKRYGTHRARPSHLDRVEAAASRQRRRRRAVRRRLVDVRHVSGSRSSSTSGEGRILPSVAAARAPQLTPALASFERDSIRAIAQAIFPVCAAGGWASGDCVAVLPPPPPP